MDKNSQIESTIKFDFRILEVDISYFRGYDKEGIKFIFPTNKKVFIFSGANGFGKTSFFDAIEWCFLGEIKRITKNIETKKDGNNPTEKTLINNIDNLSKGVKAKVRIKFLIDGKQFDISRESKTYKHDFKSENTKIFAYFNGKKEETTQDWLENIFTVKDNSNFKFSERFSDYHFCSLEKNLRLFQQKRDDIHSLLSILFGDNKLEVYKNNIDKVIEGASEKRDNAYRKYEEFINSSTQDLLKENIIDDIGSVVKAFNDTLLHGESSISVDSLLIGDLRDRYTLFNDLIFLNENKVKYKYFKEYLDYDAKVVYANTFIENVEKRYHQHKDIIEELKIDIDVLDNRLRTLNSYKNMIKSYLNSALSFEYEKFENILRFCNELKYKLKVIKPELIKEAYGLDSDIKEMSEKIDKSDEENKLLKSENSNLISIISYAEKHIQNISHLDTCPLCRRDINLDDLINAIEKTKLMFSAKESEIAELTDKKNGLLNRKNEIIKIVNTELKDILEFIDDLTTRTYDKLQVKQDVIKFKDSIEKYNIDFKTVNDNIITSVRIQLYEEVETLSNRINTIDFHVNTSEAKKLILEYEEKLTNANKHCLDINEIEMNLVKLKLECLRKIENNNKYITAKGKADKLKREVDRLDNKLITLDKLKKNVLSAIKNVEQSYKSNLEEPINYVYRKINRHCNFAGININIPDGITKKVDPTVGSEDNMVNISNILSSGQITTVALSFFLGIAFKQNVSKFKAYFFDDPIQHMDDLNILSFFDLLRVHLADDTFANQLFISTCDDDIEDLLTMKMTHFNIGVKKFIFEGYSKFKEQVC